MKSKSANLDTKVNKIKKQVKTGKEKLNKEEIINIVTGSGKEREYYEEYIHMFTKLKANIRKLERTQAMSPSTRNVYALIAMYSQQREIIADIRALSDYTENVNHIMSAVVQPLFASITQSNLDIFYHVRKMVIENCKDDATQGVLRNLEALIRDQAKFLQDKYDTTSQKIVEVITQRWENHTYPNYMVENHSPEKPMAKTGIKHQKIWEVVVNA